MNVCFDYPFRFGALFRRYLWGWRRLDTMLGKVLGEGDDYAERWELVDHGADQHPTTSEPGSGRVNGRSGEFVEWL